MDVVTTYLYGSLDANVYMKIPKGFTLPEAMNSKPRSMYSIKFQRSLYGLKQSGQMWYNCETLRKSNFLKKGKMIISVKIHNFSRSWMAKRTSPLESSHEI